jgi:mRNA-degrading endonuclease toxin of MazEF toxin-antitoxin module
VGLGRRERWLRDQRQEPLVLAPVIIFKKLAHGFYFVIPTTTKPKVGSWFVPFRQADRKMIASLHQARAIDHRRLSTKLGQLDDSDLQRVREGFWKLYK